MKELLKQLMKHNFSFEVVTDIMWVLNQWDDKLDANPETSLQFISEFESVLFHENLTDDELRNLGNTALDVLFDRLEQSNKSQFVEVIYNDL